jgi:hypothetical protein
LDNAARAFDPGVGLEADEARDREIEKLHAKIGRLTIENDFSPGGPDDEHGGPQRNARSR